MLYFLCISGIGWLIDFGIYFVLTVILKASVGYANIISGLPAITFVFIFSVRVTFKQKESKIGLPAKYIIYIIYQLVLISLVSSFAQFLFNNFSETILACKIGYSNMKIVVKVFITPITMIMNFIVMKNLVEKL
jgi:putative flippase GtrA